MSAIDHVRNSDTLRIGSIAYHLESPLGSQDGAVPAFCKPKDGPLAFTLAATDLGLPLPSLNLPFTGTADEANSQIVWHIDQRLDLWESIAHITRVRGQITTTVSEPAASLGTACDGIAQRAFLAALATTGAGNELVVETSVGDAQASNISLMATVGEVLPPVFFQVAVSASHWLDDGCGMRFQAPNTDVIFTALTQNLVVHGVIQNIRFTWTVTSGPATISDSGDQQSVSVHIDGIGIVHMKVKVDVITDIDAGSVERHFNFAVFDERSAGLLRSLCQLRQHFSPLSNVVVRGVGPGFTVGGRHWVDPLWDPTPDFSRVHIAQLRRAVERIAHVAPAINKQLGGVLEKGGYALDLQQLLDKSGAGTKVR